MIDDLQVGLAEGQQDMYASLMRWLQELHLKSPKLIVELRVSLGKADDWNEQVKRAVVIGGAAGEIATR